MHRPAPADAARHSQAPPAGRGTARRRLRYAAGGLLAAALLSACSPAYVLRAGYEEAKILWRRQPIEDILRRADVDAVTREKLQLTLDARLFARDTLGLRVGDSYTTLARVDADQAVHVVSAAPRFALRPYTWWFPIVGHVPYKGYFDAADADAEAARLERRDLDTYVRPSVAFSTLGWFADPLLSNLLAYDRVELAIVIIHELLHNTIYLGGHADFDESFATFVGHRGAIALFAARGDSAAVGPATRAWEDALTFSAFLGRFTTTLRDAYARGIEPNGREQLFAAAQAEFRTLPLRDDTYRRFGTRTLNNAVIVHYLLYADRLALFEAVYQAQGGDLTASIRHVIAHARGAADPFAAVAAAVPPQP
jgi:predicted aminopeptidase